mgnify:CR=1 FL=1|jgi:DMSO/TMAO reductase YedYZ heme-binding membrane subunit|tara:strand:+ start:280 stop:606 length:327 start_codon:yes stop_codon:yes gene_type:complete
MITASLYFLMGVIAPSFLNLLHLVIGVYVVNARGSVMSLGFSGISFLTKSMGMIFFTWLGVSMIGLDYRIFVPILCFFWFFSHLAEAFVIQHYIQKNVPQELQDLQIK